MPSWTAADMVKEIDNIGKLWQARAVARVAEAMVENAVKKLRSTHSLEACPEGQSSTFLGASESQGMGPGRDFGPEQPSQGPAPPGTAVPWRTYIEGRMFYSHHKPTLFWAWQIGGALELMSVGRHDEAYSRVALLVLAAEQLCIDGGSPVVVQELVMEDPSPMVVSRAPDPSGAQFSRLVDERWAEVIVGDLQDKWALEMRRQ